MGDERRAFRNGVLVEDAEVQGIGPPVTDGFGFRLGFVLVLVRAFAFGCRHGGLIFNTR